MISGYLNIIFCIDSYNADVNEVLEVKEVKRIDIHGDREK